MGGRTMTPALAYGSPVNVQMVSPSRAVATGDFAVRDSSVAGVVDALTAHGITATASPIALEAPARGGLLF